MHEARMARRCFGVAGPRALQRFFAWHRARGNRYDSVFGDPVPNAGAPAQSASSTISVSPCRGTQRHRAGTQNRSRTGIRLAAPGKADRGKTPMNETLALTDAGLYCAAGDFYVDPWLPVPRALITHAHGDHARSANLAYLAAADSLPLLRARLGADATIDTI